MKVSFEKPSESNSPVIESTVTVADAKGNVTSQIVDITPASDVPSPSTAVATANTTVAVAQPQVFLYDDQEIELDDIRLPRINIVQKVGDLSNVFDGGEIVLDQELVIHTAVNPLAPKAAFTPPLSITLLGFKKLQFAEKVVGGAQGLLLKSEEAVVAAGGTLDYKEWDESLKAVAAGIPGAVALRRFEKLATALVLIECPEHLVVADADHISFPHECGGKWFALALWSMKGSSYTNAAKAFFTARRMGHLRDKFEIVNGVRTRTGGGYPTRAWTFTTKLEQFKNGNYAYIPVVRPSTSSSADILDFVTGFLQGA